MAHRRTFELALALAVLFAWGCSGRTPQIPCNVDAECLNGERCRDGFCTAAGVDDAGVVSDAGAPLDGGSSDAGTADAGERDGGDADSGADDGGVADAGVDAGTADAGSCGSHDEDGDGIDDLCDVCPTVSDVTQDDVDLDGVGDACDPHANDVGDVLLALHTFAAGVPAEWTATGWSVIEDALFAAGPTTRKALLSGALLDRAPLTIEAVVDWQPNPAAALADVGLFVGFDSTTGDSLLCMVRATPAPGLITFQICGSGSTHLYDQCNGLTEDRTLKANSRTETTGVLRLVATLSETTSAALRCERPGLGPATQTTSEFHAGQVGVRVAGSDVELRSFAVYGVAP